MLKYVQITSENDKDIPYLLSVHRLPEILRFISIDEENYFHYVTTTENVFYFKVFTDCLCHFKDTDAAGGRMENAKSIRADEDRDMRYQREHLAATVHCELEDGTLYMSLMVVPEFQKQGIGTEILKSIQRGILALPFADIKVSIDRANTASLRLFRKMGFVETSVDEDLIDYSYSSTGLTP